MDADMVGRRTLQASSQGIAILKKAIKRKKGGQTYLAGAVGCVRQTIWSLLRGNPTDCDVFMAVCKELELEWEAIAEPEAPEPEAEPALDALVKDVRQKVHANIQKRCGEMRVLDMTRPIDLDTIYTDVNILHEITGRRRLELAELLEHCGLEEFDRLGFAHAQRERKPGLKAVEEFDKLILLGKPGAGKTTFLKRLATLCNGGEFQEHRVPIFITLKDFGDSSTTPKLLAYICQWFQDFGVQEAKTAEYILSQGRGLLLLDGLDEVSEKTSKQVMQEIQSFSVRFTQNAFVVSCRIAAREFTFQQFTEVEVADFNDPQIADFATRWFQAKQLTEKPEQFLAKLKEQPRIKELATNPLLLTLLCLVFEGRTDFPANRSELYKEGLDVLLKKWDGTRSIEREQVYRELSIKRKEDLLSQIAFVTFESGNYFFKQKEAERLIETYIQNLPGAETDPEALRLDSEAVLKSIEAQHGLLVERARGIYSFSHLTFHEYFTARRIEKREELYSVLTSQFLGKRWREVLLLTLGMVDEADSLLMMMKSQTDRMLATDKKLQQFLTWIHKKSRSVDAPYKPTAIRAFYFALAHALSHAFEHNLIVGQDFSHILNRERNLAYDINQDLNRAHALNLDKDLAYALNNTLIIENNSNYDKGLSIDINLDHASSLTNNPALKQCIKYIRDQLPNNCENRRDFKLWWQINGSNWTTQLQTVMIEHRNIGHDWQFSDAQEEQLQQYYDANRLLVTCLNSDCYVSRLVREEIEASLLLPIAELEEQFPHQQQE